MKLDISPKVRDKLNTKHGVTEAEIRECMYNRAGDLLIDVREDHKTDPPTTWFIARTNGGRKLKILQMQYPDKTVIKTAYPPNKAEETLYFRKANVDGPL